MKLISFQFWQAFSLFLVLSTLELSYGDEVNLETLKLVQIITRHGERVPEKPYPTDPYNSDTFWKEGWGQLTDIGKRQAFDLGQYLRERYQDYVSDKYVPGQIYALSSELDRTIMSAQLCLAGIFPAENGTAWNIDLNWQPIPLRTIAAEHDDIIRFKKTCPKYDSASMNYFVNSPEMKELNLKNRELFENLTIYSGTPVRSIDEIDDFYATLMVEEMLGLKIPDWSEPIVHTSNFQYLYNLSFASGTATTELKRLKTGPLVEYLVNNMNTRVSNSSMKTKFFLLSGHDTTLVAVLNTLGLLDLQRPYYSSVFMLELHQDKQSKDYFVNIVYRNDTTRDPYQLKLPGCEFNCSLDYFLKYTRQFIPEDWEAECTLNTDEDNTKSAAYYIAVVSSGIVILGFVIYLAYLIVNIRKGRTARKADYQIF